MQLEFLGRVIISFLKYLILGLGAISGFDLAFISESSFTAPGEEEAGFPVPHSHCSR